MTRQPSIRKVYSVVGLFLMLMFITGFHSAAGGETPNKGGTLIHAMEAVPDILDAHVAGRWHIN